MLKRHSFTLIEDVCIADYPRAEFEAIHAQVKGDVKMHLTDILIATTRGDQKCRMTLVYDDGRLVGASVYRTKNNNTPQSTTVLYNLFSIAPGAGSSAFESYWKYAHTNSNWFKFFVFKRAHAFYQKYHISYWGASKTGQTFSSLGRIHSANCTDSMDTWKREVEKNLLSSIDRDYLERNLKIFIEKHNVGVLKLKSIDADNLQSSMLSYKPSNIELDLS